MYNLSESDNDTIVHARAKQRGQATFTLVEQDRTAPQTICHWITANIETAPEDKLRTALEAALKFRKHPNRKDPD